MTEPLIENSKQTIPINSSEQVYSENNAPYTESHQNQSQNQPYVPSNELSSMYKENPDKTNSLPITPEVSYGFSFIFSTYLLQSLIYIGIFFLENIILNYLLEKILIGFMVVISFHA